VAEGTLHVRVVSPEKLIYEGDASALVVPAWDGFVGILPRHAPFLALLGHGRLTVEGPGGAADRTYYVAGGVLKVENNQVTVLTEYAGAEAPAVIPPEAIIHLDDVVFGNPLI
jgi:F-type H+-transporting ATPase subunit epsilon